MTQDIDRETYDALRALYQSYVVDMHGADTCDCDTHMPTCAPCLARAVLEFSPYSRDVDTGMEPRCPNPDCGEPVGHASECRALAMTAGLQAGEYPTDKAAT